MSRGHAANAAVLPPRSHAVDIFVDVAVELVALVVGCEPLEQLAVRLLLAELALIGTRGAVGQGSGDAGNDGDGLHEVTSLLSRGGGGGRHVRLSLTLSTRIVYHIRVKLSRDLQKLNIARWPLPTANSIYGNFTY